MDNNRSRVFIKEISWRVACLKITATFVPLKIVVLITKIDRRGLQKKLNIEKVDASLDEFWNEPFYLSE